MGDTILTKWAKRRYGANLVAAYERVSGGAMIDAVGARNATLQNNAVSADPLARTNTSGNSIECADGASDRATYTGTSPVNWSLSDAFVASVVRVSAYNANQGIVICTQTDSSNRLMLMVGPSGEVSLTWFRGGTAFAQNVTAAGAAPLAETMVIVSGISTSFVGRVWVNGQPIAVPGVGYSHSVGNHSVGVGGRTNFPSRSLIGRVGWSAIIHAAPSDAEAMAIYRATQGSGLLARRRAIMGGGV